MKHEQIVELIREAGFDVDLPSIQSGNALSYKLVKLAIETEREACAKVCDGLRDEKLNADENAKAWQAYVCAAAIRARGES